ncbi:MAG TPA: amidase [Burkholderiales bacterium]|nr:amidase [Burkholderiales bacterium]
MEKLYRLGLREAAQRIREGALTAEDLTRACLTRCSRLEPRIEAWQHLAPGRALERAEHLDAARSAGSPLGPLHGIALGIKDIIDVAGMPTTMGSPIHAGRMASTSAPMVEGLEAAGAVILGKTVTTEFAYYTPNKTKNPWNTAHTPGGSSMGSAAAVAAGMACGAIGTQTNGSVIRPAAFCGVVGYKPSHGSIPIGGTLAFAPTFDTVGVFTRSIFDAAWLAAALVAAERRLAPEPAALSRPPRLAAVRSPVWDAAENAQKEILAANVAALRHAGATVSDAELPTSFDDAHAAHRCIMACEGARNIGPVQDRHRDRISARLNALLDEGASIPDARYREALATQKHLQQEYARYLREFDAVVSPPAPGEAPATLGETGNPAFCTLWTLLGVPAITIPVGLGPRGMPLGLQIVGGAGHDDELLSVAAWCERVFPFAGLPGDREPSGR